MYSRKRNEEDDKKVNKFLVFFMLNLLMGSSVACAMERKITLSVNWNEPDGIIFYYTLPGNTTIHSLKQRIGTSLLNNEELIARYLYLKLIVGNDNVVIQDSECIKNLFDAYQSNEYALFAFFNNKRQTTEPIDDPSIEGNDIPEPAKKKRRR